MDSTGGFGSSFCGRCGDGAHVDRVASSSMWSVVGGVGGVGVDRELFGVVGS